MNVRNLQDMTLPDNVSIRKSGDEARMIGVLAYHQTPTIDSTVSTHNTTDKNVTMPNSASETSTTSCRRTVTQPSEVYLGTRARMVIRRSIRRLPSRKFESCMNSA